MDTPPILPEVLYTDTDGEGEAFSSVVQATGKGVPATVNSLMNWVGSHTQNK